MCYCVAIYMTKYYTCIVFLDYKFSYPFLRFEPVAGPHKSSALTTWLPRICLKSFDIYMIYFTSDALIACATNKNDQPNQYWFYNDVACQ